MADFGGGVGRGEKGKLLVRGERVELGEMRAELPEDREEKEERFEEGSEGGDGKSVKRSPEGEQIEVGERQFVRTWLIKDLVSVID